MEVVAFSDRGWQIYERVLASFSRHSDVPGHFFFVVNNTDGPAEKRTLPANVKLTVRTLREVEKELYDHAGIVPMWLDPTLQHSQNANFTGEMAEWDGMNTHNSPFNHLRFYIPHLRIYEHTSRVLFIDDDVLFTANPRSIYDAATAPGVSLLTSCVYWTWGKCDYFERFDGEVLMVDTPVLHWHRGEEHQKLLSHGVRRFGANVSLESLPAWNFGASMFDLTQWRRRRLTHRYHEWLRFNVHHSIFPPTSLAFGLGVPWLVFAGEMQCLSSLTPPVMLEEGLGHVTARDARWNKRGVEVVLNESTYVHFNGPRKPWMVDPPPSMRHAIQIYRQAMGEDAASVPPPPARPPAARVLLLTSYRSGSEWLMSSLDMHPAICASGTAANPAMAHPTEALMPPTLSNRTALQEMNCRPRALCAWAEVARNVQEYTREFSGRCTGEASHALDTRGQTLCAWAARARQGWSAHDLFTEFRRAQADDLSPLVPCGCEGKPVFVAKVMHGWIRDMNRTEGEGGADGDDDEEEDDEDEEEEEGVPEETMQTKMGMDLYRTNRHLPRDWLIQEAANEGTRLVSFTRDSCLLQKLSLLQAQLDGKWHSWHEGKQNITRVDFDTAAKLHACSRERKMRASDVRAFLAARVPLLQLRYEDCVHNISACANAVARWTGQTEIAEPPGRDLATQKATSRHPSEYVSNWPQVVSQVCASNKAECAHLAAAGLAKAELACGAPAAGQSAARRRLRPVSVIELATQRTDARPHDVSDAECTITCEHAPNEELLCHLLPGLRPPSWRPPRALSAVSGEAQCAACLKAVGQPMRTLGTPRVVDSQVTLCPVMNPQFNCPRGDKWVPSWVSSSQAA